MDIVALLFDEDDQPYCDEVTDDNVSE